MKITWREIKQNGDVIVVAFIDTEGLDLGIDAMVLDTDDDDMAALEATMNDDGFTREDAADDTDDIEVAIEPPVTDNNGTFNLNKLYFGIKTFKKFTTNPREVWDPLFLSANRFLSLLSAEDQRQLCLFYIEARRAIDWDLVHGAMPDVATYLGNKLYDIAVEINLHGKLLHYAQYDSLIPIPDMSYAGTNIGRDTPELTFCADNDLSEYYILLAISVLCKLLCPIWGDLIGRTVGDIDNIMKETHCTNVIEPILSLDSFRTVRNKLYGYVSNIVDSAMKRSYPTAGFTATIGGVSHDRFCQVVYSTLIVKRYATIDHYITDPVGNILIWTSACAKQAFSTLQQTLNKRCRMMPRTDISDSHEYGGGDDERNVSVLEYSSRVTDVTADIPPLIRFGVRMTIKRLCQEYNIAPLDFQLTVAHYQKNPIRVTDFNKIFVGIFTGNQIGGAQGLKYLDLALYMELVAITQIYIATHYAAPAVVHLLTAVTPEDGKLGSHVSNIDNSIQLSSKESRTWRDCEDSFPYEIGDVRISTTLRLLQDHIIKYDHFANTAPLVGALMDTDDLVNGALVPYGEETMMQCCEIILGIIQREKQLVILGV